MKTSQLLLVATLGLATFTASAATHYVSLDSPNPSPPYTNWATAAHVIQDALDGARTGDMVLVTNGVYALGERDGNRVAITNSVTLLSVNGPLVTVIDGNKAVDEWGYPTNGVRCLFLGANAVLSGFTLTNGRGGVYCEASAVVTNCILTGNSAEEGGGAFGGTLYNCTLTGNRGTSRKHMGLGGGVVGGTLFNCTLSGNLSDNGGGGAWQSTLYNCVFSDNMARDGGGASRSTLYNCTLIRNSAETHGGGACESTLYNCIVYHNTASYGPNCWTGTNDWDVTLLNYCCTSPMPTNGIGNIDAEPRFVNAAAGNFRLRPDSPCIDAGTNLSDIITADITGDFRPWDGNRDGVAAFDMGAYEFRPSPVTLYVSLQSTNPTPPYATWATAATNIQDAVDAAKAGDTVRVTNGVYAVGARDVLAFDTNSEPPRSWSRGLARVVVTNSIRLESVNGPTTTTIRGARLYDEYGYFTNGIRCVFIGFKAVLSGFTLTNGIADTGKSGAGGGVYSDAYGTVTNCVLMGNLSHHGGGAYGCCLYDCVLQGNANPSSPWAPSGGGACSCTLYNCTVMGNSGDRGGGVVDCTLYSCTLSANSAGSGGGAASSTLYNCTVTGNSAIDGGGATGSTLYNCTVSGNSSFYHAGGVSGGTLYNCIVYYNNAPTGPNYDDEATQLNYSCTTPLTTNGIGNITGPPLFMDMAAGDFRLWEGSPCIDAGVNLLAVQLTNAWGEQITYSHDPTDILGNTRFIDGNGDGIVAWDIGAYEFNSFKPPRFTGAPRLTSNGWKLNITGAANKWVQVQRSSDLRDWGDVWPPVFMGPEGIQEFIDWMTDQSVMFYRAVVE